jgi:hypothetical protein
MIGGGNYVEFQNLQDWAKKTPAPNQRTIGILLIVAHVIPSCHLPPTLLCSVACVPSMMTIAYGCTELQSPDDFLAQLTSLGRGDASTPPKPDPSPSRSSRVEVMH